MLGPSKQIHQSMQTIEECQKLCTSPAIFKGVAPPGEVAELAVVHVQVEVCQVEELP